MTNEPPILTHPIPVDRIRPSGETVVIEADEAVRKALAAAYDLPEVRSFTARLVAKTSGAESYVVSGIVEADIVQLCGVTLEPFPARVSESVEVVYAPPGDASGEEGEDIDLPDPLTGRTIDLGAVALEFFALGIDPYPRKPGIAFSDHIEDSGQEKNPFAALAALKKGGSPTGG